MTPRLSVRTGRSTTAGKRGGGGLPDTTGRSSSWPRRARSTKSWWTPRGSPATTRPRSRSRRRGWTAARTRRPCRLRTGWPSFRTRPPSGTPATPTWCTITTPSPTSGSTSFPTVGSPGFGSTAPRCPTPGCSVPGSTWRHCTRVATSPNAPTCSIPTRACCSTPESPGRWPRGGRPRRHRHQLLSG